MPYERNLIRTNRQRRVNGIHMVDGQLEYRYAIATEAVRAVLEVCTGLAVYLAAPREGLARVHVMN